MLYQGFAEVFTKMDGKKTLQQAIREAEWDKGNVFTEPVIRQWLYRCIAMSELGYLGMEVKNALNAKDLVEALRRLGVRQGDTVLVHSGLSGLGYFEGGTGGVIAALREAVGAEGTFLAPAFSNPFLMYDGDVNKGYRFRPYDTRPEGSLRDKTVRTGALPAAMLKEPDVFRSGHATHEWAAIGRDAEACTAGHGLLDVPTGENSPLKKALDRDGSVLFLGCHMGSNTFLHYVELHAGADYTTPACIQYIDARGKTQTAVIGEELFGCRNFYGSSDNEFYREACRRGLRIWEEPFGMAVLYRMELRQLYEITMEMLREDPYALLCKKPGCPFCSQYIK
jgi:aminoglycoside N3'-acetyltransferase